ncbi:gem (nuclear organelle) associated protein 2 [Entomortierella chlamydospora]|uniref:Gem (Nuclear organelle) associated protein 2 n=1 Tax=Entomortierella chlamydospora TaxID=101097 RepID=A0A9P6MU66_9FUNG|nr:gem (nuclear organelle) associated protein 2 [Entomortierella chlamydospora]KAG0013515.1 gem (nuclear organelle) associated protein 2 [Entomortierella chlamydospora]
MDNMLPSSGEEYLRMVKAQAKSCPAVVVAPQAKEYLSVKNTSLKYKTDWYSCRPAPEGCAPTTEWKEHFMKEFGVARANLKQWCTQTNESKLTLKLDPQGQARQRSLVENEQCQSYQITSTNSDNGSTSTHSSSLFTPTQLVIPKMFDEQGWRALLYGTTTAEPAAIREPQKVESIITSTSTVTETVQSNVLDALVSISETTMLVTAEIAEPTSSHEAKLEVAESSKAALLTREQKQGMVPRPFFLAQLNQGHLIQLLKYHLRWMAEDDITDDQGRWLYALFLKLDPLVESDQVAILRNLAKKCARIRSHLNSKSGSKLATVNMVITIVAQLFGQNDLE